MFAWDNLKWSKHCHIAAAKGSKALGILINLFARPSVDTMKKLYCFYVRPYLRYQYGLLEKKYDISLLENVHRRATKVTKGIHYVKRLKLFRLQNLEERREI